MSRTVTRPRTSTRIRAAVVAVALGAGAVASAGSATAADAPRPVPLMPGATVNQMIVADEAVTESWLVDADGLPITADGTYHPAASIKHQAMAAFLFRFIDAGLVPTPQ